MARSLSTSMSRIRPGVFRCDLVETLFESDLLLAIFGNLAGISDGGAGVPKQLSTKQLETLRYVAR
jgi:hypothetical protein